MNTIDFDNFKFKKGQTAAYYDDCNQHEDSIKIEAVHFSKRYIEVRNGKKVYYAYIISIKDEEI
jgi:hypothetical protein